MNKLTKLAGAAGVATLVAISGTAFTASSSIEPAQAAVNVGAVSQSVSGVTVQKVTHTYVADTDTTDSLEVKVAEWLDTTAGVMKVKVNGTTAQDCGQAVQTDGGVANTYEVATDYSTVTCDIANTAGVTSLQFIVNG